MEFEKTHHQTLYLLESALLRLAGEHRQLLVLHHQLQVGGAGNRRQGASSTTRQPGLVLHRQQMALRVGGHH